MLLRALLLQLRVLRRQRRNARRPPAVLLSRAPRANEEGYRGERPDADLGRRLR